MITLIIIMEWIWLRDTRALMIVMAFVMMIVAVCDGEIINEKVVRKVVLAGNEAVIKVGIRIHNEGKKDVTFYDIVLTDEQSSKLAVAHFFIDEDIMPTQFQHHHTEGSHNFYRLPLLIKANSIVKIRIELVFVHYLRPSPREMIQGERLFVSVDESTLWISPYSTTTQTTTFRLGTSSIASFTSPGVQKKTTISYGPFEATSALTSGDAVSIRFFHDKALITATQMIKEIKVSHWGTISLEENYAIENSGAKLKGSFSRALYNDRKLPNAKAGAFHFLHASFPQHATDMYFRDEIGNVSTSRVRPQTHEVWAEFAPRFPLMGGWSSDFYLGYTLPSVHALYSQDEERFVLELPFGTSFRDIVIDEEIIRVILPEGSTAISWSSPHTNVIESPSSIRSTYLDFHGRPVLEIRRRNVVSVYHNAPFQVYYHLPWWSILLKPFILFMAVMAFFVLSAIYMRMNFSLSHEPMITTSAITLLSKENASNPVEAALDSFNDFVRHCIDGVTASTLNDAHTRLKAELKALAEVHDVTAIYTATKQIWKNRDSTNNTQFQSSVNLAEKAFEKLL